MRYPRSRCVPAIPVATSASMTRTIKPPISLTRSGVRRSIRRTKFTRRRQGDVTAVPTELGLIATLSRLSSRHSHHVADPAQRMDQPRLGGVHLAPQVRDVRLHDVGVAAEVV